MLKYLKILGFFSLIVCYIDGTAQAFSPDELKQGMAALSKQVGVSRESRFYPKLKGLLKATLKDRDVQSKQLLDSLADGDRSEEVQDDEFVAEPRIYQPQPILKHFRGNQGVAFPSFEKVYAKLKPDSAKLEEMMHAPFDPPQAEQMPSEIPDLPECDVSDTNKTRLAKADSESEKVTMDMLFVKTVQIPPFDQTIWGKSPVVRVVNPESADFSLQLMKSLGAECLPFRLRVTPTHRYLHTGFDALRNYDGDPNGKGVLNEFFANQEKIRREEGSSRP